MFVLIFLFGITLSQRICLPKFRFNVGSSFVSWMWNIYLNHPFLIRTNVKLTGGLRWACKNMCNSEKKQVNSIQHIRVAVISDVKRPLWNAAEDHFFRTDGRIPHKGESSHLSYATARHQALNLTPMWTRCGVPTAAAAAQQQRYCFNAVTWLNYATTSLCHREEQQSRWTRNAQSSQKDLKL